MIGPAGPESYYACEYQKNHEQQDSTQRHRMALWHQSRQQWQHEQRSHWAIQQAVSLFDTEHMFAPGVASLMCAIEQINVLQETILQPAVDTPQRETIRSPVPIF